MASLKLKNVRFIVTMDPERRIIRDGSVIVDGQRITHVGKAADLEGTSADREIDAREMVLTPGFCNGHMHISYAHATRGIFPDDIGNQYLHRRYDVHRLHRRRALIFSLRWHFLSCFR